MSRPKTNPDKVTKNCPTCKKDFVISFYLRKRRMWCSRKCANHDPSVIEKMKESQKKTFDEKYGCHPMQTEETKKNLKESVMKKHGVEWASQIDGWYNKVKQNNLVRYGVEHYNNIGQMKDTCIKRYGVDNPTKYPEIRSAINETKRSTHYKLLKEYCSSNRITLLFDRSEYKGFDFFNKYRFRCEKCDYVFEVPINDTFNHIFCEKCDPDKKKTLENDFFNFLSSLSPTPVIKRHDRTILYGKELDFYLPDKKIAFELNGLYWHSENGFGISRIYHLNKSKGCLAHGIRLVHIFENEWRDNPELVKSIVKTILKIKTSVVIYARECEIREVNNKEKNEFLNNNHLQKEDKSTIKLGLYHRGNLMSIMSFRKKSRFDRTVEWELSRFCNRRDTVVIGGASRLFSHFTIKYFPKSIVSYCDRRYFSGDIYNTLGFKFVSNSSPSYHYITPDYKSTINRMNFQKHLLPKKLKNFDPSLSEWENMKANGFDRIWDCGHSKWVWTSY